MCEMVRIRIAFLDWPPRGFIAQQYFAVLTRGTGVLGAVVDHAGPLRLDDVTGHPVFAGFPADRPPMTFGGRSVGAMRFSGGCT